jgi:hypothetical protein
VNIQNLHNSVKAIVADVFYGEENIGHAADAILLMLLVESWTHKAGECLSLSQLTDAEYRIVNTWVIMNRRSPVYQNSVISFIKDMREVFPGLGLKAASDLVRGS